MNCEETLTVDTVQPGAHVACRLPASSAQRSMILAGLLAGCGQPGGTQATPLPFG